MGTDGGWWGTQEDIVWFEVGRAIGGGRLEKEADEGGGKGGVTLRRSSIIANHPNSRMRLDRKGSCRSLRRKFAMFSTSDGRKGRKMFVDHTKTLLVGKKCGKTQILMI